MEKTPAWEDWAVEANLLGIHLTDGIVDLDADAGSLRPVAWATGIREDYANQKGIDFTRPMIDELPDMTRIARTTLDRCMEWQTNAHAHNNQK